MNLVKSEPLVSVIIPCYNQAQFLPDALNCLIQQTYENWECIIINDGSIDDTEKVANDFLRKEERIQLINQSNRGLSGARNRGLDEAQGEFIQFLDADDIIESDKLRLQVETLLELDTELAVCYSDFRYCPENNIQENFDNGSLPLARFSMDRPIHDLASRWETQVSIPVHAFLFNACFFKEKAIRFDENLPNHEDWDCWMQIFTHDPIVKVIPKTLAIYRFSSAGMCRNKQLMLQGFRKAIIKQKSIFQYDPIMQQLLTEKLVELKHAYIKNNPSECTLLRFKAVVQLYRKYMPWSIQNVLTKLSNNVNYFLIK